MSTYWPTSSAVVPGCTVGCQSCKISGSNVKLLFWPAATTKSHNGSLASVGSGPPPITAVAYGTTLTSPTVYISFDRLHASNSCRVIGQTLQNIIVPITNSATLSSLYGWDRYWGLQQTAPFNFTDLYIDPVPDSMHLSKPATMRLFSHISHVFMSVPGYYRPAHLPKRVGQQVRLCEDASIRACHSYPCRSTAPATRVGRLHWRPWGGL